MRNFKPRDKVLLIREYDYYERVMRDLDMGKVYTVKTMISDNLEDSKWMVLEELPQWRIKTEFFRLASELSNNLVSEALEKLDYIKKSYPNDYKTLLSHLKE